MHTTVAVLAMLLGLGLYFIPANAKVTEIGRLVFFAGTFWLVHALAMSPIHLP